MAVARKAMRNVNGFTDTVKAQFMDPAGNDRFTPDWDEKAAAGQAMVRDKQRTSMGRKMSPIGRGTLKPSKR